MERDKTGRKIYTDEEILELGRLTLAKHKITVYVVHYTNKYGEQTISVYGGPQSAQRAADDLISWRVSESWDKTDQDRISAMSEFGDRLDYFHAVEQNVSNGERIEVLERVVGA